jgi:hypothetical protein
MQMLSSIYADYLLGELVVGMGQVSNELSVEEKHVIHHIVPHNRLLRLDQLLNDQAEAHLLVHLLLHHSLE